MCQVCAVGPVDCAMSLPELSLIYDERCGGNAGTSAVRTTSRRRCATRTREITPADNLIVRNGREKCIVNERTTKIRAIYLMAACNDRCCYECVGERTLERSTRIG